MIGRTLVFLREHLDELLRSAFGEGPDEPTSDKVVFLDGDQLEPLTFKLGAVSELLINVEEERLMSRGDPYTRRIEEEGKAPIIQRVQPDIRLILYVLFVARFKQYDAAWDHLSRIIEHFQVTRMFERETAPGLPEGGRAPGPGAGHPELCRAERGLERAAHHPSPVDPVPGQAARAA